MLKNLRKSHSTLYEPSFIPGLGFCYKGFEAFGSLREQLEFFEALEKVGAVSSKPLSISALKCCSCDFP
jgi:hypothetical protein